jgi:hypothetical protein
MGEVAGRSVHAAMRPVFESMGMPDRWSSIILDFANQSRPYLDHLSLDHNVQENVPKILAAIDGLLGTCSVFCVQPPPTVCIQSGLSVRSADLTMQTLWRFGPSSRDDRIPKPFNGDERESVLLHMRTMMRAANVVMAELNPMASRIISKMEILLRRDAPITPDLIFGMLSDLQSAWNGQSLDTIVKLAPILYSAIKGEVDIRNSIESKKTRHAAP